MFPSTYAVIVETSANYLLYHTDRLKRSSMRSMATQTEVNGRATYRHSMPITAEDLLYPPRPVEMVSAEVQTNGGLGQPPPPINTNNAPLNQLPSANRLPGMCNVTFFCLLRLSILGPLLFVKKYQTLGGFWFVFVNLTYRTLRLQTPSVPY